MATPALTRNSTTASQRGPWPMLLGCALWASACSVCCWVEGCGPCARVCGRSRLFSLGRLHHLYNRSIVLFQNTQFITQTLDTENPNSLCASKVSFSQKQSILINCLSYDYQDGSDRVGEPSRGTTGGVLCSCSLTDYCGKHASNVSLLNLCFIHVSWLWGLFRTCYYV